MDAATNDYLAARVILLTSRKVLVGLIAQGSVAAGHSLRAQLDTLKELAEREVGDLDIRAELERQAAALADLG